MHGCLPVGGSGDTGMFEAGYTGQGAGREAPFRRTAIITEITAMLTACGEGNSGLGTVGFFCVFVYSPVTVGEKSVITAYYRCGKCQERSGDCPEVTQ